MLYIYLSLALVTWMEKTTCSSWLRSEYGIPVSMIIRLMCFVYEGARYDTARHLTFLRDCLGGIAATQVQSKFKKAGLRVKVDRGSERLAKQIRTAEKVTTVALCCVGTSFFVYM